MFGGGTDTGIYAAAGNELLLARQAIDEIPRGTSVITSAFRLYDTKVRMVKISMRICVSDWKCANRSRYPYQVYMNWSVGDYGNIFFNDKKFVTLFYEAHEDYFSDMSKVTDASQMTKEGIYRFLERSKRCAIVVDCENSDPYKLYAALNNLNQNALLHKIAKIILYDDVHTTIAWDILNEFTEIPVEHQMIERVKENKSLVDIRLTTGTCREFFRNDTDSFILDSAYINTRADMSTAEKKQFYERYIRPMRLVIEADGEVFIKLRPV